MKADYPLYFINSFVNEFQKGKECGDENFITPPSLFEITKSFIFVEILYCKLNEIKSKRSLFPLKDKKPIINCVSSIKGIDLLVHITNIMQKLDGMNIIIQIKFQNHQTTFGATSTTILHGVSFQKLQKLLRPGWT